MEWPKKSLARWLAVAVLTLAPPFTLVGCGASGEIDTGNGGGEGSEGDDSGGEDEDGGVEGEIEGEVEED